MRPFPLKIVTPDGSAFDGMVESVTVRTTSGELGLLFGHMDLVAPLGMGRCTIITDGEKRSGACIGGMISMLAGKATLVPTTFEWAEDIDADRAQKSYERAQAVLSTKDAAKTDIALAEARLKRALVRKSVASNK